MNTHKKLRYSACACLLFIILFSFAASYKVNPQQTAHNVIIILDPEENETKRSPGAMADLFLMTLQQKAAPIIVTQEVVATFCFLTQIIGTENLKEMRETIKNTQDSEIVIGKTKEIYQKILSDLPIQAAGITDFSKQIPIMSVIDLDDNNWHAYIHTTENLMLLIPQEYINKNKQGDIKKCGFDIDKLTKITNLSPDSLALLLEQREKKLEVTDEFMNALESMFIQNKPQPILRITPEQQKQKSAVQQDVREILIANPLEAPWNIYVTGHGNAPEKINHKKLSKDIEQWQSIIVQETANVEIFKNQLEELPKLLETLAINAKNYQESIEHTKKIIEELSKQSPMTQDIQQHITKLQMNIESTQKELSNTEKSIKDSPKQFKKYLEDTQITLKKDQLYLAESQNMMLLPEGHIIPGVIAGLDFAHFSRILKFFDKNIKTSFLHYSTCFGGGVNQAFLNDELKKLNVNFIVAAEGISETSIGGGVLKPSFSNGSWTFASLHFNVFFNLLNEFFGNITSQTAKKEIRAWKHDPLKAIMQSIVSEYGADPEYESVVNTPFIRFPSIGVFSALGIDKKMKILTNSIVRAYELEGEPINLSNTNIEYIIVYPQRVGVTLNMGGVAQDTGYHKAIIVPTPTEFSESYKAVSIFEKIIFEQTLSSFLFHLVAYNASTFKKIFLVKELACWDYATSGLEFGQDKKIVITNMIAVLSPNESGSDEPEPSGEKSAAELDEPELAKSELSELEGPELESYLPELPEQSIGANLDICFEYNGVAYCGTIHIPEFESNKIIEGDETGSADRPESASEFKASLIALFNELVVSPADQEKIQSLAQDALDVDPTTLQSLPTETQALLAAVAQKIDDSVEKIVVKPGALKKILEKQRSTEGK